MPTCDKCGENFPFLHCVPWRSDQDYLCDFCCDDIKYDYDDDDSGDLDFDDD